MTSSAIPESASSTRSAAFTSSATSAPSPRKRLIDAAVTLVAGVPAAADTSRPRRRATRAQAFGAEAIGIRAVAEAAGVTHAAPLHHFPDRVALLAAVAAEGHARLGDAIEQALSQSVSPADRLRAVVRTQALWAARHAGLWDVMCSPQLTFETAAVWRGRRSGQTAVDALSTVASPAPASAKARERRGEAFDHLVDAKVRVMDAYRAAVEALTPADISGDRATADTHRQLINALTTLADGLSLQFVAERDAPDDVLAAHADATVNVLLAGVVRL